MTISIANATTLGAQLLDAAGVGEPRMEAGSLLAHVLGRDRTFIIAHAEDALTDEQMGSFRRFVGRRAQGEPLQYITGLQEFFKLDGQGTVARRGAAIHGRYRHRFRLHRYFIA